MPRKLAETVVLAGVIYPAGTSEKDIDGKVDADVWEGDADTSDASTGYGDQGVDDLTKLAAERKLEVAGTGKDGNVLKADLVKALEADDAAKA